MTINLLWWRRDPEQPPKRHWSESPERWEARLKKEEEERMEYVRILLEQWEKQVRR